MTAFLDTNVLIHAQGDGPKGEIARRAILEGGTISVQVLNESASILRRKFHLEWDAIAVAIEDMRTALEAGCDVLLTEDMQAGRRIAGMTIVNPFK